MATPRSPSENTVKTSQSKLNATFTTIQNPLDPRLLIIKHDQSGGYNVTKTGSLISQLKKADSKPDADAFEANDGKSHQPLKNHGTLISQLKEADSEPDAGNSEPNDGKSHQQLKKRGPLVADWLRNQSTQAKINMCAQLLGIAPKECVIKLVDVPNEYKGTYVHRYLYEHFVQWIDAGYAMKVSFLIDAHNKAVVDSEISELRSMLEVQSREIKELITLGRDNASSKGEMKQTLDEVNSRNVEMKQTLDEVNSRNKLLLKEVDDVKQVVTTLNEKFDGAVGTIVKLCATPDIVSDLVRVFSKEPTAFSSQKPLDGISSVKIIFTFGIIDDAKNETRVQVCSRTLDETPKWLKTLSKRVRAKERILGADVVAICDKEVNLERALTNIAIKEAMVAIGKQRYKEFTIHSESYAKVVKSMRDNFTLEHQTRIREVSEDESISAEARRRATFAFDYCVRFNTEVLTRAQAYVDCFFVKRNNRLSVIDKNDITATGVVSLVRKNGESYLSEKKFHHFILIELKRFILGHDIEAYLNRMLHLSQAGEDYFSPSPEDEER